MVWSLILSATTTLIEKMRYSPKFILLIVISCLICVLIQIGFAEYRLGIAWQVLDSKMANIGICIRASRAVYDSADPMGYINKLNQEFENVFRPGLSIPVGSLGDTNTILFWLPYCPNGEIVFITASPIRKPLTRRFTRVAVTKNGDIVRITPEQFTGLLKQSYGK